MTISAHNVDSFWPVFLPFAPAKQLAELIRDFAAAPHYYPAALEEAWAPELPAAEISL